jgi:hypothetical protein
MPMNTIDWKTRFSRHAAPAPAVDRIQRTPVEN